MTEKLAHAIITGRIGYCNSLLYGLPNNLISKLQHVQNACAHLVWLLPKFCHVSPLLQDLHWLPVKQRIDFKIILITFKTLHNAAPLIFVVLFHSNPVRVLIFVELSTILFFTEIPSSRSFKTSGDRAPFCLRS